MFFGRTPVLVAEDVLELHAPSNSTQCTQLLVASLHIRRQLVEVVVKEVPLRSSHRPVVVTLLVLPSFLPQLPRVSLQAPGLATASEASPSAEPCLRAAAGPASSVNDEPTTTATVLSDRPTVRP